MGIKTTLMFMHEFQYDEINLLMINQTGSARQILGNHAGCKLILQSTMQNAYNLSSI